VTATRAAWTEETRTLAKLGSIRLRRLTSFIRTISRMCAAALSRSGSHRHVACNHCDRHFEVDRRASSLGRDHVVGTGPAGDRAALVHQGLFLPPVRQRLIGRDLRINSAWIRKLERVGKLMGARQRRHQLLRIEIEVLADCPALASLLSCSSCGAQ